MKRKAQQNKATRNASSKHKAQWREEAQNSLRCKTRSNVTEKASAKHEQTKRPNSPTALAWSDTKRYVRLVDKKNQFLQILIENAVDLQKNVI